jgi:hypothetical protein
MFLKSSCLFKEIMIWEKQLQYYTIQDAGKCFSILSSQTYLVTH